MTTHELKCWPESFNAIASGRKRFEARIDDRGYQVGDVLQLREWDPSTHDYTGRALAATVTYLMRATPEHPLPLPPEVVIMSLACRGDLMTGVGPDLSSLAYLSEVRVPLGLDEARIQTLRFAAGLIAFAVQVTSESADLSELQVALGIVKKVRGWMEDQAALRGSGEEHQPG